MQATFLTTWRRARGRRLAPLDHATALPWLLGVAGHEAQNATRSLRRAERRDLRAEAPGSLADHADDVAARIDDERQMAEVRRAMIRIPEHQRTTIELVLWSGLSLTEAADVLHVAEGTVKSRLSRGRAQLTWLLAQASHRLRGPRMNTELPVPERTLPPESAERIRTALMSDEPEAGNVGPCRPGSLPLAAVLVLVALLAAGAVLWPRTSRTEIARTPSASPTLASPPLSTEPTPASTTLPSPTPAPSDRATGPRSQPGAVPDRPRSHQCR